MLLEGARCKRHEVRSAIARRGMTRRVANGGRELKRDITNGERPEVEESRAESQRPRGASVRAAASIRQ